MKAIPIFIGLLHSCSQLSVAHTAMHNITATHPPALFSLSMHIGSFFSILLTRMPCKISYTLSSGLMILSFFIQDFFLQRALIGFASPTLLSYIYYSQLPFTQSLLYTSYYNIGCLIGVSIGILQHIEYNFLILAWIFGLIISTTVNPEKSEQESTLPQIISVKTVLLFSFLIELLGESVLLSAPVVLSSVWNWEDSQIDYFLSFAHIISVPLILFLIKRPYYSTKHFILTAIGICGVASSMLTSLYYSFLVQQCVGICLAITGVNFSKACICFFVKRAYGSKLYIYLAVAGIFGKIIASGFVWLYHGDNNDDLFRNLFLPITLVICASMAAGRWRNELEDHFKLN